MFVALQVDLLTLQLAQPRDLAILEVRLGEDLAVHLDEDLLDDFGARRDGAERQSASRSEQATTGHLERDMRFVFHRLNL